MELYKALPEMRESEIGRLIGLVLDNYPIPIRDRNAIDNCVAELVKRGFGYHARVRRAELNQFIFDNIAMMGK